MASSQQKLLRRLRRKAGPSKCFQARRCPQGPSRPHSVGACASVTIFRAWSWVRGDGEGIRVSGCSNALESGTLDDSYADPHTRPNTYHEHVDFAKYP